MGDRFDEAAFRVAVDMWWNNPDRSTTHRILTGARHALGRLDEARAELETAQGEINILHTTIVDLHAERDAARAELADILRDRDGFVEEIRDLNDQLAGARANVTALKTSCQSMQNLVDELRAERLRALNGTETAQ